MHVITIKRDGITWWYWACSCGAQGASHTTPYDAKMSAEKYHPQGTREQACSRR